MSNVFAWINRPAVLLGSLALNIFLVAFFVGRMSVHPDGPLPFLSQPFSGHYDAPGERRMPPPPFFGPEALFTPEEMRADMATMKRNFEAGQTLRKGFAEQLKQGPITKQFVLDHFAEIDRTIDEFRKQVQERAAAKISSMTPDERREFADRLLERTF